MAPTDITAGPDGNLWFTLNGDPGAIGRITPEGVFTEFSDGLTPNSRPTGIAEGTDGALWFTEAASPGRIGRITTRGNISEYSEGLTADRSPWFITPGPDGNMWFTENANPGVLARISLPPAVRGRSVQYISDNSAQLPAKIRPNAQDTEFYFEYGRTETGKKKSVIASAGAGWDHVEVMTRVANLRPATTYHYRVVATNDSGTSTGPMGEFTTKSPRGGARVRHHDRGRPHRPRSLQAPRRALASAARLGRRAARGRGVRYAPRKHQADERRSSPRQDPDGRLRRRRVQGASAAHGPRPC